MADVVELYGEEAPPEGSEQLVVRKQAGTGFYEVSGMLDGDAEPVPVAAQPYRSRTEAVAAAQSFAFSMAVPTI